MLAVEKMRRLPVGFAGHTREIINFQNHPIVELRGTECAKFIVRGVFAMCLIVGEITKANANPSAFLYAKIHKK